MRVIGGEYRRRRLFSPGRGMTGLRPTYDFVRESIFNLINSYVPGSRFLDLFAGTGCVGIEALSRGAADCVFVDSSRESLSLIQKNCEGLKIAPERYKIAQGDVPAFLKRAQGAKFDIIFLDPPYGTGDFEKSMVLLGEYGGLAEGGIVVGQHGARAAEDQFGKLERLDQRKYGKTWVSLWGFDRKEN